MKLCHGQSIRRIMYIKASYSLVFIISLINVFSLEFLKSEEGQGFSGQVSVVADSIGSILAYDALSRTTKYQSRHGSENSILENDGFLRSNLFFLKIRFVFHASSFQQMRSK